MDILFSQNFLAAAILQASIKSILKHYNIKHGTQNEQLERRGVPAKQRPKMPKPNHKAYPRKQELALSMLQEFVGAFPDIKIKGVLADALYGIGEFIDQASAITGGAQVVSQLRSNQIVASKNSKTSLKNYFAHQPGVNSQLTIRVSIPDHISGDQGHLVIINQITGLLHDIHRQ